MKLEEIRAFQKLSQTHIVPLPYIGAKPKFGLGGFCLCLGGCRQDLRFPCWIYPLGRYSTSLELRVTSVEPSPSPCTSFSTSETHFLSLSGKKNSYK